LVVITGIDIVAWIFVKPIISITGTITGAIVLIDIRTGIETYNRSAAATDDRYQKD
jgi:hypothetical protein